MKPSLEIQKIAITIAAKQHNMTILTSDFRKYSGIEQSSISQHSIIFIDKNIPDYESLVEGAIAGTEVVLIDPDDDGVQQITAVLARRVGVTSVHLGFRY